MPSYVIKRSPDTDEYLIWSTVVGAPTSYVLTCQDMFNYLTLTLRKDIDHPSIQRQLDEAEERLKRADQHGTSAFSGDYGFEHEEFLWMEGAPEDLGRVWSYDDGKVGMGKLLTREEVFEAAKEEEP